MSKEARTSYDNGIWLCCICAKKIDADEAGFPADLLRRWKHAAEERMRQRLGKRPPRPDDAVKELRAAFTGDASKFMHSAIPNVHKAAEGALNELDPRIRVVSSYVDGAPALTIHPLEPVNVIFDVPVEHAAAFRTAIASVDEHGAEVTVPLDGVSVSGSPLMEEIFNEASARGATLSMWHPPRPAVMSAVLVDPVSGSRTPFPELRGPLIFGQKSFSFTGTACDGLISFALQRRWEEGPGTQSVTLAMDGARWENVDVRELPHMGTLMRVFERLASGDELEIALEVEGHPFIHGRSKFSEGPNPSIVQTRNLLVYLNDLRSLTSHLGVPIHYRSNVSIPQEDLEAFGAAMDVLEHRRTLRREHITEPLTWTLALGNDVEGLLGMLASPEPRFLKIVEPPRPPLMLFGQELQLPSIEVVMGPVRPVLPAALTPPRAGDSLTVTWMPEETFRADSYFALPERSDPGRLA